MSDEILKHYNAQLSYLRKQGKLFANLHPKVASYLHLGAGEIHDPCVERLLEGFAFLSARIQHNIDQGHHTITENLMRILSPHYDLPLPAFSIIQLTPRKKLDRPLIIPKHKTLRIHNNDHYCTFRTGYETEVLPLQISNISFKRHFSNKPNRKNEKTKSCFSFDLSCNQVESDFKKSAIKKVRCYINLEQPHNFKLYEILRTSLAEINITYPEQIGQAIDLPITNIHFAGFNDEDSLLPYPENSFKAYGLLTEFFAYPEKFLFFDIIDIENLALPDNVSKLSINFFLETTDVECEKNISDQALLLNCVPTINLFAQQGEPIRIDPNLLEHAVVADNNIPISNIEIYDIIKMRVTHSNAQEEKIEATPYFGKRYSMQNNSRHIYWHSSRKKCWEIGEYPLAGTEMYVVFSEFHQQKSLNNSSLIMTPELLCSNREATLSISSDKEGVDFEFYPEKIELITQIKMITHLTKPRYREHQLNRQLDLLNHLSLNQLGFNTDSEALETLKRCLSLYNVDNPNEALMIEKGLCEVHIRSITKRINNNLRQSFSYGTEYTLVVDESYFTDQNILLFSAVLQVFLQRMSSINNFTQLILVSKQRGLIKSWEPISGTKK